MLTSNWEVLISLAILVSLILLSTWFTSNSLTVLAHLIDWSYSLSLNYLLVFSNSICYCKLSIFSNWVDLSFLISSILFNWDFSSSYEALNVVREGECTDDVVGYIPLFILNNLSSKLNKSHPVVLL